MPPPRIAFFPDSFHEVNGVAHTARNFAAYAERHEVPMLVVRAGPADQIVPAMPSQHCSVQALDLRRSRIAIPMERDLAFDPLFARFGPVVERTLRAFAPTVIHITGPSEFGILGAYFAWRLGVPLAASWHTNVHEYAARRLHGVARHLGSAGEALERAAEAATLSATARFYRLARVIYAPHAGLCRLLQEKTQRPCHLMQRGVDTQLFTPARRTRAASDTTPVLGFVGRFSVEKNVALLPRIAAELSHRGVAVRWILVGHGSEEAMLRREMSAGTHFPGVLRGEALAEAYADMDVFVFPSHTDTFGNVVLEALASGVPAVVTPDGGPATIVADGVTGRVAADGNFADAISALLASPDSLAEMKVAARAYALRCTWDAIFDDVLLHYPAPDAL